jgi:hypothetical protein
LVYELLLLSQIYIYIYLCDNNRSSYTNLYMIIIEFHAPIYTCSPKFHISNSWGSFDCPILHQSHKSTYSTMWPDLWYLLSGDINSYIMKRQSLSGIEKSILSERWIHGGSGFWAKIKTTNYAMIQLSQNR